MPDINQTITLTAVGGDASASEIAKTSNALNNVTHASSGLESQFSHRFTHIGLQLFATDLLRASGLGNEARQIIGTLQTAITAGAAAFGAAAGPILLVGAALAALIGIVSKVIENNKGLVGQLEKARDAQTKQLETVDATIDQLHTYIAAGGEMTDSLRRWLNASEALRKTEIQLKIAIDERLISTLKATIAQEEANNKTVSFVQSSELMLATVLKQAGANKLSDDMIRKVTESINDQNLSMLKHKQMLAETEAELERLRTGSSKSMQGIVKDEQEISEAIEAELQRRKQQYQKMAQGIEAISDKAKDMQEADWKQLGEKVKVISGHIGSSVGGAFAKMIVEGKNFNEAMTEAFKNMAEQIISDIIRIEIEWAILTALGFPAGGGLGGLFAGGFATGGSVVATGPTMAVFGESGPEMATFTPIGASGSSGGSGGGGDVYIGSINLSAHGVQDPKQFADDVGRELVRSIRGRGQISFVRGS